MGIFGLSKESIRFIIFYLRFKEILLYFLAKTEFVLCLEINMIELIEQVPFTGARQLDPS